MVLTIKMRAFNLRARNIEEQPNVVEEAGSDQSSARHARAHRKKLQEDPEAWTRFKEAERVRHRERPSRRTEEQKQRDREKARIRQQRFAKKREQESGENTHTKKAKVLTRSEKLKKTEYNRIKKRESRARMTPQQRRRMREKDAERRRSARAERKKKKQAGKRTPVTPTVSPTYGGFLSMSARRMALSRLWSKVPKDPEKFGDIVDDFLSGCRTTPRKKAALARHGLLPPTNTCKKTRLFQEVMANSVRSSVLKLKRKKDASSLRDRRLLVSAHLICRKYRMQNRLAKQLDVRPNYLSSVARSLDAHDTLTKGRKRRSDATCMEMIERVRAFYTSPKVSRELPYMRTVKKQVQRRVMEVSIGQAYKMWKDDNKNEQVISLSSFQKMRPKNVLLQRSIKLNQCLCESCTDIMLKLQALNRAAQTFKMPEVRVKDKYELVALSLCQTDDNSKYGEPDCINRECPNCGIFQLRKKFEKLEVTHGDAPIHWLKWEDKRYEHDGKTKTKKVVTNQSKKISDLLQEILDESETLAKHLFVANWQQTIFTEISTSLPQNWALLVLDFAENYSCLAQDEIQSAHWATQQVTVHPIVAYYNCVHPDSTHITQEALAFLSDDLMHDFHAVHHFESIALKHLKEYRGLSLAHVLEFTDGCASQYKSRRPFADISYAKQDFGLEFERAFFGSRHGKGPSDGVSGVVKSAVPRAVISRRAVVNTAEDMLSYCKDNLTLDSCRKQQRSFFFVKKSEINRDRPEREVKNAVQGTRSFHCVQSVEPGVINTRLLGCFCEGCIANPPRECTNSTYTSPWQRHKLKMTMSPVSAHRSTEEVLNKQQGEIGESITSMEPGAALDISLTEIIETMSASDNKVGSNEKEEDDEALSCLDPEVLDACRTLSQFINTISLDAITSDKEAGNGSQSQPQVLDPSSSGDTPVLSDIRNEEKCRNEVETETVSQLESEALKPSSSKEHTPTRNGGKCHNGGTSSNEVSKDSSSASTIDVNSFVAIKFDAPKQTSKRYLYMAMVTAKGEGCVRVKFMKRTQRNSYIFTVEEESTHPLQDVATQIAPPVMEAAGRALVYRFSDEHLQKLAEDFDLK